MSLSAVHTPSGAIEVKKYPYPEIADHQLVIKTVAYAVNPTDFKHSKFGLAEEDGAIAGSDASGVVEEVGSKVTGFKKGDVVSTFMRGNINKKRGAFAEYIVADPETTIKYSNTFKKDALAPGSHPSTHIDSYEAAASVTLGLTTIGISFAHWLGIRQSADNSKDTILIWGGATASGALAIQIAKLAYGLKVVTTASPKNHEFVKSLGADAVFDYRDPQAVQNIRNYAGSSIKYALDTISNEETLQSVYDATSGSPLVTIDNLLGLTKENIKTDPSRKATFTGTLAYCALGKDQTFGPTLFKSSPQQVADYNDFWNNVLPPYIGQLRTLKLRVLKPGLESANEALSLMENDAVSGEKAVWRR